MPKVTIDSQVVEVPNGTLVVEAAKKVGVDIPVFCYHPKLQPVGMCRMCLVEIGTPKRGKDGQIEMDANGKPVIGWMPKLQTACTTVVSEGMAVCTTSKQVEDARRSVVEFLLTSHPLDCPICDKGGECPLQNLTMAYGPGKSRFPVESKFHNEKRVPLGDLIMLDRERCIQCSRCIRFQDEIADDHVLGFQARGRGLEIVSLSEPAFDSKFSGNTIDICPVGALTSRDFRLSARVWEVRDYPSVCGHCSVGCNMLIGERDHLIKRIVPRENESVNEIFLCDKGRFVHHYAFANDRLTTPLIRKNGKLETASWNEALDLVASKFAETKKQHGAQALGGLGGDRVSNEDLYLFQKLFRLVIGSNNVEHRVGWSATNVGGEFIRLYGAGIDTNLGSLDKNVTAFVIGADPEEEQPVIRLRLTKSVKWYGVNLIVANGRVTKLAKYAKQSLVYKYGAESMFLLGMVRTILDEGLDAPLKEFVAAHVKKIDEYKKSIEPFTVEKCAELCHVKADKIREAARAFAKSPDALILYGREAMFAQQHDPAVASSIEALLLLTGHVGRKNNGLIALYPHNNSTGAIDFGLLPTHGAGRIKLEAKGLPVRDMTSGKVRALYAMACDPALDGNFTKPDFLVVQDLFLTETAKLADVVLPAQSFAERDGTFTNTERRVQFFRAALKPIGETKPDWWIVSEIAKRLGGKWEYNGASQVMDEISTSVSLYKGMTYAALSENVKMPRPPYGQGNPSDQPTEIAMGELENISSGKMWASVAESDPSIKFDLVWNEPRGPWTVDRGQYILAISRSIYDRGTLVSKTQIVQPRVPKPVIEINSQDAEQIGIETGARVRVSFDSRVVELNAIVDGHVPPNAVLIPNNLDGTDALPMGAQVKVEKI
ncbi:MAG: NADH-quinone oxidoreductase subunit NuoG [Chloroflexi bacterium]|nr:NADH-quinone oxidoreductase subunit NuoG [Chloroflexota bacterium]